MRQSNGWIGGLSLLLSATVAAAAEPGRAMWLWTTEMIKDSAQVADFLTFSKDQGIGTIYAQNTDAVDAATWADFIKKCGSNGMAVEALMGDPQWILNSDSMQPQLDWIKSYQDSAAEGAKFSGIHADVEPWTLEGWDSKQDTYIQSWQIVITEIAAAAKELGVSATTDLPFWANTVNSPTTGDTMDVWMLNHLDAAVFMTYRNKPDALLDIAKSALQAGETTGKPVWLAVETTNAAPVDLLSYYGQSLAKLDGDLDSVEAGATSSSSFAGIAIHDYDGAVALS